MMKKRSFIKSLSVMLVAVTGFACFSGCGNKDDNVIYIGASGPLTGENAIYGTAVKNSAKMAVDEINANGGLNGVKFKFDIKDDVADETKVEANYYAMYEAGMQVSLGCVTSTACMAFKSLAKVDNVFFMTPSATADSVTQNDENAYQMCFSDNNQGSVAASYVNEHYSESKVGIFYKADDVYSTGIYNNFIKDYTGTPVTSSFTQDTATDFSAQIEMLKECDFIFMPIYYRVASGFMLQAQKAPNFKATVFYGCDGFDGLASYLGGELNTIKQEVSYLTHFTASATEGKAGEFVKKYTEKYKSETLNQFGASAYDCVYALYGAMQKAVENGKTIDGKTSASDMCKYLKEVFTSGYTFTGVTGDDISWNADGTVVKTATKEIVKNATFIK